MAQEIKLKFIVAQNGVETLREQLNVLRARHTPTGRLLDIYYEIADNWLRRHDMGLRIRGDQGRYEMALKIADRVVGGLHQRPGYSIPLDKSELALERLPAEVWPQGEFPAALAEYVQPLFSTDFARERWMIQEGNSETETALDRGEVEAGEHQESICELELELLTGETADLLRLAHHLLESGVLRQGGPSKAARGYHLMQGSGKRPVTSLTVLTMAAKASVEQGLKAALESALVHWLYHDEVWPRGNAKAKAEILLVLARVCHTFVLFGGIVPRKTTTQLRTLLNGAGAVLLAADIASKALLRAEVIGVKLALTGQLVQCGWRPFLDEAEEKKIAGSLKRLADIDLSRVAAELRGAVQHLAVESAADRLPKLSRDIDNVQLLVGAYSDAVAPRLENWQELHRVITHDDRSVFEYFRRQALATESFWLHSGKRQFQAKKPL